MEKKERRAYVSLIPLATPEESGQPCLRMTVGRGVLTAERVPGLGSVPFTRLGTHTAKDITTWEVLRHSASVIHLNFIL